MPRFEINRMLRPASVNVSGAATPLGQRLLAQLHQDGFAGPIGSQDAMLPQADIALIADDGANVQAALAAQAELQVGGAIVVSDVADLRNLAQQAGIRTLGPHSFGLMLPGINLNASTLPLMPCPGQVALVAQSASLARTVIDWAVPNSIGFSQIIGIGGNADIGFGLVLDHLSRDPGTNAIMIEVDRVRDPRLFYSAARAAARLRPVVALAPGARWRDADGISWAAYEAAFARAGVLLTGTISEFLAAAETLTRVKPARGESLAILSNTSGWYSSCG